MFYRKADFAFSQPPDGHERSVRPAVGRLVRDVFGREPVSLEMAKLSTFHYVYRVALEGDKFFVKVAKAPETKETLLIEHHLYEEVLQGLGTGLRVLAYDIGCGRYPFAYLILSKAPGVCLRSVDFAAGEFSAMIRNLGRALAEFHSISMEHRGFGLLDAGALERGNTLRGSRPSWRDHVLGRLPDHLAFAYDWGAIDAKESDRIRAVFASCESVFSGPVRASLLHGDLGSHNVFVDPGTLEVEAIIDWEDALIGDAAYDIALFASFYRMHEFLDPFLEGYASVGSIEGEDFLMKLWLYYLRVVLAKSVLRFKLGYDPRGRSKSSPKIRRALGEIDKLEGA